jgi:hypothetical protein
MRSSQSGKELLEPADREQLLRGWLLHAHKARDRHEESARFCESRRYLFGGAAVVLSAVSGSTVFASIGGSPDALAIVLVGGISILAAVFAALQTFLDYPGRAARHHVAAVKYKAIIRELEQALTGPLDLHVDQHSPARQESTERSLPVHPQPGIASEPSPAAPVTEPARSGANEPKPSDPAWTTDLRARLDALEEATPVVDDAVWSRVEHAYANAYLVERAVDFGPSQLPG